MKKLALLLVGVPVALLGALWLVQGLGVVRIEPIACVAECEPLQGPSPTWVAAGLLMVALGALAIYFALRRRPPTERR